MTEILLIETPVANLANIARALRAAAAELCLSADPRVVRGARTIVLPGVGSFVAAKRWLDRTGVGEAIRDSVANGSSLLGICVGQQLLFEQSEEFEPTPGLGLLRGSVTRFEGDLPLPQIGWNRVFADGDPLFDGIESGTPFYFLNSFRAVGVDPQFAVAHAVYGAPFVAAARAGRVCGVQFHPEKSSRAGLQVLRNFLTRIAG